MNNLVSKLPLPARLKNMDRQQFETLFTSGAFIITTGFMFLNSIMLSRGLGDGGRGQVAAVFGNTVVLGWAFQIGVPNAVAYFAKDADNRRLIMTSWAMTLFVTIPMAVLLVPFFLWQMGGDAFRGDDGTQLQIFYVLFIVLQMLNGPFTSAIFYLRGIGNTFRFNVLLALPQFLITFGYFCLFITGTMTVTRALTSTFVLMALGWGYALVSTGSLPGRGFEKELFKEVRNWGLRAWVGNLSFVMSNRIDQLVLVAFVSKEDLGLYAVAAPVATISGAVARGIAQSLLPFIRNAESDDERLARIRKSVVWVAAASGGILIVIAVSAQVLVPLVFGSVFAKSVTPLLILLPGAFAADVTQVYNVALQSFNKPEDSSKAQIAAALVTVAGLIVLLPTNGIVGAAITTTAAYWVALLLSAYYWNVHRAKVKRGEATGHTEQIEQPA